jgi:Icc-related predicted phosphoesterase
MARGPRSKGSSSSASAPGSRSRPGNGASTSTTRRRHSPPRDHCDSAGDGTHFGSPALLAAIEEKRPKLAVCGHIHESWGCESEVGGTPVRNLGPTGTWIEV